MSQAFHLEAGHEVDRLPCRTSAAERNEYDLVADGQAAVPTTMLPDEHAVGELRTHGRHGKCETQRGDVRAQAVVGADCRCDFFRSLGTHARIHVAAPVTVRPAVES